MNFTNFIPISLVFLVSVIVINYWAKSQLLTMTHFSRGQQYYSCFSHKQLAHDSVCNKSLKLIKKEKAGILRSMKKEIKKTFSYRLEPTVKQENFDKAISRVPKVCVESGHEAHRGSTGERREGTHLR